MSLAGACARNPVGRPVRRSSPTTPSSGVVRSSPRCARSGRRRRARRPDREHGDRVRLVGQRWVRGAADRRAEVRVEAALRRQPDDVAVPAVAEGMPGHEEPAVGIGCHGGRHRVELLHTGDHRPVGVQQDRYRQAWRQGREVAAEVEAFRRARDSGQAAVRAPAVDHGGREARRYRRQRLGRGLFPRRLARGSFRGRLRDGFRGSFRDGFRDGRPEVQARVAQQVPGLRGEVGQLAGVPARSAQLRGDPGAGRAEQYRDRVGRAARRIRPGQPDGRGEPVGRRPVGAESVGQHRPRRPVGVHKGQWEQHAEPGCGKLLDREPPDQGRSARCPVVAVPGEREPGRLAYPWIVVGEQPAKHRHGRLERRHECG